MKCHVYLCYILKYIITWSVWTAKDAWHLPFIGDMKLHAIRIVVPLCPIWLLRAQWKCFCVISGVTLRVPLTGSSLIWPSRADPPPSSSNPPSPAHNDRHNDLLQANKPTGIYVTSKIEKLISSVQRLNMMLRGGHYKRPNYTQRWGCGCSMLQRRNCITQTLE